MEIHFYFDKQSILESTYITHTYQEVEEQLSHNIPIIHTTSLSNLSFDLLDLGYRIFLHKNGKILEAKPGMHGTQLCEVRRAHNILKMWLAGSFDSYFDD